MLRRSVMRAALGVACIVASLLAHAWLVVPTERATLSIAPERPACHAGQSVRLVAFVQRGRVKLRAAEPLEWGSSDTKVLSIDRAGLASCRTAGLATVSARQSRARAEVQARVRPAILEVTLARPSAPEPPPPPAPPAPPKPRPQPKAAPKRVLPASQTPPDPEPPVAVPPQAAPAPEAAPEAAQASALLVAHAPGPSERAVTAPPRASAGSGIVAASGTAAYGVAGARVGGKLGATGTGIRPRGSVRDRSRAPRLRGRDPCSGYFPEEADADRAMVDMDVAVAASGRVAHVEVLGEVPRGEGFGLAAMRCFQRLRLDPALDGGGSPVAATLRLRFTFER